MATNDITELYQGQLPSTVGTLYTAPNGSSTDRTQIRTMHIINNGTVSETISLYKGGTAEANKIYEVTLGAGESSVFDGLIVLTNGQTFSGVTTTASEVTVTIDGMEMT